MSIGCLIRANIQMKLIISRNIREFSVNLTGYTFYALWHANIKDICLKHNNILDILCAKFFS